MNAASLGSGAVALVAMTHLSLRSGANPRPIALVAGFASPYGDRLSSHLRAVRTIVLTDGPGDLERIASTIESLKPHVAVVRDEAVDTVELAALVREHPDTGFVVVARNLTRSRQLALEGVKVAAMLPSDVDGRLLVLVIHAVARGVRGGIHVTDAPAAAVFQDPRLARLSSQETVVLELLKEHRQLQEIAGALSLGLETVRTQTKSIYRKLGVSSRAELRALLKSLNLPGSRAQGRRATPGTTDRLAFRRRCRVRRQAIRILPPLRPLG